MILTRREFNTGLALTSLAGCGEVKRSILFPGRSMTIPQITNGPPQPANQNQAYSFQFTESGGIYPFTWSAVITPNTGGAFSINPITGLLSGTQSVVETETVTVTVSDAMVPHNTATATYAISINSAVVIQTSSLSPGTVGVPYNATLVAIGGTPPYTWTMNPTNLDGLTLNASTGVLSGTPTTAETISGIFTAKDSLNIPSAPVSLSFTAQAAGTNPGPQQLWPGTLTSTSLFITIWPPNDGSVPDSYNLYRTDIGQVASGLIPRFGPGGSATGVISIKYVTFTDITLAPSTTYTFFATAVTGGVESAQSPTLVVTTIAGSASATTLPTAPTDPATYFPAYALPTGTRWTATQNAAANANSPGPVTANVGCGLQYALTNAVAGDVIVVSSGLTYTSTTSVNAAAFNASGGSASGYIYVVSDQDPGFNSSGALTPYSFVKVLGHTTFTATATVAAGATALTLTTPFNGRSGWYKTIFSSTVIPDTVNKSGIETRQALYQNGQTSVIWNVGLLSSKKASFSVGVGNNVTPWDAGVPIGPANTTNSAPSMPTIQFSQSGLGGNGGIGIFVNGTNYRFVGINIQPKPSWTTQTNPLGTCVVMGGTGNILDRCVIGRDNTNATTLSYFSRSVSSTGTNNTIHQCYIYGADNGPGGGDSQGINLASNGPMCAENSYIEAVSENFMAGGSRVAQSNQPHDLTLRYNWTHKPTAWQQVTTLSGTTNESISRRVKNHYELKCCTRAAWIGNVHQNNALLQASVGQGARCYVLTPRDQVSATAQRGVSSITWAAGVATVGSSVIGVLPPAGTVFSAVIQNCPIAGYNGTFVGTVKDGLTFTYPLPVNPGGNAGAFANGYVLPPQAGGMWQSISDVEIRDNQCYAVGSMGIISGQIDYNPVLNLSRLWVHNNLAWINPAMTDELNNTTPMVGIYIEGYPTDVSFNNNTIISVPKNYGYSAQGAAQPMIGLLSVQNGSPNQLVDRWTVTNNIIDGDTGGTIEAGSVFSPPNLNATGGPFVQFSFTADVVWNKDLFVLDTSSGANAFPGTTYNPIAYSAIGFSNFIANTTIPASASDWNVVSGPYATASTTGGAIGATFQTLQFPLVGAVLVAPEDYSTVANIGKPRALVLENFPGFSFGGKNITQQVTAIKALNPASKVFTYVDIMEIDSVNSGAGTTFHAAWVAITAYNWFLRTTFPAGSIVQSQAAQNSVNITQPRLSASNDPVRASATYRQWYATFAASYFPQNADGIFTDNFQLWPKQDGDYAESGSSQSRFNATTTQNWRNAYADWVTQAKAVAGGPGLVIGNIGDWGQGGGNTPVTPLTGYVGILDGGAYEGAMGAGFSLENTSWVSMMNNYAVIMQNMKTVNYMFFMHDHSPVTGYAAMRYGLCSCLLDNGYYYFNLGGSLNSVSWFDEFDFVLGSAIAGPNNPNNGTYSSGGLTVWSQGVWRRDFQNGIILVNPRGNTAKTVTLETTYWHLRGTQDTTTNNAAAVTSVTLPDPNVAGTGGSGLFLSRTPT